MSYYTFLIIYLLHYTSSLLLSHYSLSFLHESYSLLSVICMIHLCILLFSLAWGWINGNSIGESLKYAIVGRYNSKASSTSSSVTSSTLHGSVSCLLLLFSLFSIKHLSLLSFVIMSTAGKIIVKYIMSSSI